MSKHYVYTYLKAVRVGKQLKAGEYRVLVSLLSYANMDGTNAHPGIPTLAGECGMSERQVSRCITSLKAKGWLIEDKPGRRGKNGDNKAAVFNLEIPKTTRHECPVVEVRAT